MIQSMDLRRLCSTILDKTIADPDMYQNGLTKIFFRAGMLAALESFRSDRLNAMVTVVQKNVRRRLAVKQYGNLRHATIKIQTWWRGILARRFVESIRREVSAIRIQTAIRCFVQRKRLHDTRASVVLVQSRESSLSLTLTISFCFLTCASRCTWHTSSTKVYPRTNFPCRYTSAMSFPWRVSNSFLCALQRRFKSSKYFLGFHVVSSSLTYAMSHTSNLAFVADSHAKN